ncbi:hypothetical protein PTSG_05431 [Salpingoeca rosetta]|uniref:SH2 domain-containing protein n=1 Tax=Salpingoeca rosetta (strain ATCC 50818 / BSB-021) TaxID=946362 RepID=F2UAF0_SALR5|nr:uncharacterized protein PTSG_05431 [Salpingoeca rosetta]EGD73725.1 hypothetical protein PTSG_05431 [Salpingoeca rosetta]|eukprot:XP_004994006.1 hypothetical protein PTSG_05431 [Salpingoeca rosetta]
MSGDADDGEGEHVPLLEQAGGRDGDERGGTGNGSDGGGGSGSSQGRKKKGGKGLSRRSGLRASLMRASAWFGVDDAPQIGVAVRASKKQRKRSSDKQGEGSPASHSSSPQQQGQYNGAAEGMGPSSSAATGVADTTAATSASATTDTAHLKSAWFHGRISAQTARRRLETKSPGFVEGGVFLVRQNSHCENILVLACNGRPWSFKIHEVSPSRDTHTTQFRLGSETAFHTMPDLIAHYRSTRGGLPCRLTAGVPRRRDNLKRMSMALLGGRGHEEAKDWQAQAGLEESNATSTARTRDDGTTTGTPSVSSSSPPAAAAIAEYNSGDNGESYGTAGGDRRRKKRRGTRRDGGEGRKERRSERNDDGRGGGSSGGGGDRGRRGHRRSEDESSDDDDYEYEGGYEIIGMDQFTPWFTIIVTVVQVIVMAAILIRTGLQTVSRQHDEELHFGCCVKDDEGFESCGMTAADGCPADASFLGAGVACPSSCSEFRLRPCCTQSNGTCQVLTRDHCTFLSGIWQSDAQLCSDVSCLKHTCGFSMKDPSEPNQWYRFFTSIFVHAGIIHIFIVATFQWTAAAAVERKCGFLRMLLMYTIACVGGNLVSGIFSPLYPQVGAAGGVFGVLGISIVDLFHSWPVIERPMSKLLSLLIEIAVLFFIGTLPWIDNFAHIGGFVFGAVSAVVFLPYVTFGKFDAVKKGVLLCVCIPLLIALFAVALILFYEIQDSEFCPGCDAIQCISWVSGLCNSIDF